MHCILLLDLQAAIHRLGSGLFNKVILRFSKVFWDDNVSYFGYNLPWDEATSLINAEHVTWTKGERDKDSTTASFSAASAMSSENNPSIIEQALRARHNVFFVNYYQASGEPILIAMLTGDLAHNIKVRPYASDEGNIIVLSDRMMNYTMRVYLSYSLFHMF